MIKGTFCVVIIALLLIVDAVEVSGQPLPAQPYDFLFDQVEGASGYIVEVKDDGGKVVVSQNLTADQTSANLSLIPGKYSVRLSILDKVGQAESSTSWAPIQISSSVSPSLLSMDSVSVFAGQKQKITMKVKDFATDVRVSVQDPDGNKTEASAVKSSEDGTLEFELPPLVKVGAYVILVTNPPSSTLSVVDKLYVQDAVAVVSTEKSTDTHDHRSDPSLDIEVTLLPPPGDESSASGKTVVPQVSTNTRLRIKIAIPSGLWNQNLNVLPSSSKTTTSEKAGVGAVETVAEEPSAKIGVFVKRTGTVSINVNSSGTLSLLGESVSAPAWVTVPVTDVDVGNLEIQMKYDDGRTENKTVKVQAGQTTNVDFEEENKIEKQDEPTKSVYITRRYILNAWSEKWKLPWPGQGLLFFKAGIGVPTGSDQVGFELGLSRFANFTDSTYVISMFEGGIFKNRSTLRKGNSILASAGQGPRQDIDDYWLILDKRNQRISFGLGTEPEKNMLISYRDVRFEDSQYFTFSNLGAGTRISNVRALDWPTAKP